MKALIKIILFLFFLLNFGCINIKRVAQDKQNYFDSINKSTISKLKNLPMEPEISLIYEKLKNYDLSQDTFVVVKPIYDIDRREVLRDFGNKYIDNDTVIIVEGFSYPFFGYSAYIYTSNIKEKVTYYSFGGERMEKYEYDVDEFKIIKIVQSNQLRYYAQTNKFRDNSDSVRRLVSLFIKQNDTEFDFSQFEIFVPRNF